MGLFHWRRLGGPAGSLHQTCLLPKTNPHVGALRHSPSVALGRPPAASEESDGTRALLLGGDSDIFLSQTQVAGRLSLHRRLNREVALVRQQSTPRSANRGSTPSSLEKQCVICLRSLRPDLQPTCQLKGCDHEFHQSCFARHRLQRKGRSTCPLCLAGVPWGERGRDLCSSVLESYGPGRGGSSEAAGSSSRASVLTGSVEAFFYLEP